MGPLDPSPSAAEPESGAAPHPEGPGPLLPRSARPLMGPLNLPPSAAEPESDATPRAVLLAPPPPFRVKLPSMSAHIPTRLALACALALTGACTQDPTPAYELPDFARPPARHDVGFVGDSGPRHDASPHLDAQPGLDAQSDADTDAEPPPDVWLPPTPGPASPEAIQVLSVRADTRVGWIAQGALWSARIDRFGVLAETARVHDVPPGLRGPVLGGRTATGPAWVAIADGPDGMWRAYNLSAAEPAPVEMQIWGDARVVTTSATVVIFGRSGPEADAPVAWRTITADPAPPVAPSEPVEGEEGESPAAPESPDARRIDELGVQLPEHAFVGLSNAVLGFSDGLCAGLLPNLNLGEPWYCHARSDARAVGDKQQIYFVGQHREDLALWQAMPGASFRPGQPMPEDDDDLPQTPEGEAEEGDLDAEVPEGPQPLPASAVLATGATLLGWFSPVDGAQVAHVRDDRGEALWVFEPTRIRIVPLEEGSEVRALATNRRDLFTLSWDDEGRLSVAAAAVEEGPLPPIFHPAATCGGQVEPEDCSDLDRDCDGSPKGNRCCVNLLQRRTEASLKAPRLEGDAWVAGFDLERLLVVIPRGAHTELLRIPVAEISNQINPFIQWPGAGEPLRVATEGGRLVILRAAQDAPQSGEGPGQEEPARPDLLWWVGQDTLDTSTTPPTGPVSQAPCAPVFDVRLFNPPAGSFARVYCAESAWDVPFAQPEQPIERPYPQGPVRWLSLHAFGRDELLLAHGDDHELVRLTDTAEQFELSPEPLPDVLASMANAERVLPIRPPVAYEGWYARVNDARIEVWSDERGWRPMPSTRWPIAAQLSAYDPIGLSVVQLRDPQTAENPNTIPLDVRVHHLGPSAPPWGRSPRATNQQPMEQGVYSGMRLGDFPVTAFNRPVLLRLGGPVQSGLVGEAVQCD